MSNLEDAVNEAVPDNNYVKPLMIAAGALLLGHLFGGKKEEPVEPANPALPPAQGGGGGFLDNISSAINNALGGGQPQQAGAPQYPGAPQQYPGAPQHPGAPQQQGGGGFMGSGGIVGGIINSLSNSPLGGIVAGAGAGTAVTAGLDALLNQFRGAGHEQQVNSWVGAGQNQPISPDQINSVLGQGKIAEIAAQAGISPQQMSQLLAQALPTLVDKLTPGGRMPHG
ncbi:DUF937 domain-containing protein [Rhodoblastus acidophilus]|uniref:DUF937 domain-containing protein n=1 Tax=Rhodoblastus acidophilus TaxID=1074 RepID=A0A6N8DPY0_RHOAC|nr:YidB family protein [Rhodoblastus acidophilus]MCW2275979.1 uncharacterized protein YidB (DUF937 family) [Rhodoblastus acidophilus]MTV32652.1 DUF937 domain-containing protein [Rhodoblastus acidophilus]